MTWLTFLWHRVHTSLWFVPVMMSVAAVVLVIGCGLLTDLLTDGGPRPFFLYAGDLESARLVLSTVAGSIVTVAGVSFSVTMVALSLTSSQFGPHLLVNFMRDRGNQVVIGAFIATSLFCLLSLGTTTRGVPGYAALCASVALLLAGLSLALLIYFIHHIASSMQADHVIEQVASQAVTSLERVFPECGEDSRGGGPVPAPMPDTTIAAQRTGYLQAVDEPGLVKLAADHDLTIRLWRRPGHYVIEGGALMTLAGGQAGQVDVRRFQSSFIIGGNRTTYQDPEFGIHQLVEVAVRAMSSGINDPFTAVTCVDRLTGLLCRIAPRQARSPVRLDEGGVPRLHLDPFEFHGVLDAAFDQIRQFSSGIPSVNMRVLEGLTEIAALVRDADRADAVERQAALLLAARREEFRQEDLSALETRYSRLERVLASRNFPSRRD